MLQANPDQSKHLETANLRVLGFEIDCVHLRAETYSGKGPMDFISLHLFRGDRLTATLSYCRHEDP
jgi:hypothetical protein